MLRWEKSTLSPGTLQLNAILRNVTLGKVHPLSWNPPKRGLGRLMPPRPPYLPRLEFQDVCLLVLLLLLFCHPTNGPFSRLLEVFLLLFPVFLKFSFRQFLSF